MKIRLLFYSLFLTSILNAQSDIPIFQWKSYLPHLNGEVVAQSENKIIYATEWSLLTIDKNDMSYDFLSKVEGMSDIGIKDLNYDQFNDQLIVVYDNSNIDIIKDDEIFNVNNIKNNTNIVGDRSINALEVANANSCYFATSFGIVEYDLENREFGFTTFTELKVEDITSSDSRLYIATEDGIYSAVYNANVNLADFGNWELMGEEVGLPMIYSSSIVHFYEGNLYAIVDNVLMKQEDNGQFVSLYEETRPDYIFTFVNSGSRLMAGVWNQNITSEVLFFEENGNYTTTEEGCVLLVQNAIEDETGRIWFADLWSGIRRMPSFDAECNFPISFNSPSAETASDITFKDGNVFVASGGVTDSWGPLSFRRGVYRLQSDKSWKNYNQFTLPDIGDNDLLNLWQIESHPSLPLVYAGSFFGGLLEINTETEESRVFTKDNSTLQGTQGDESRTRISGMAFDNQDNLWVTNFGAPKPLSVFTSDGQEFSFDMGSNDQLGHLTIDNLGYKWSIAVGGNGGVYVFDDGGTPNNPTDDRTPKFFNTGNSVLSTNLINYIKADLNGDVWVGTAEGPVVFECGSGVFDPSSDCRGSRRRVLQDSIAAFLLQTEDIRVIEVDGANRKWFGTRNGVFVQSADGETQILHLTAENSPLFDNTITAINFNEETGEMWIGTNQGMQSFRTEASKPERSHQESNVFAFPNPVRPDYMGPIAIKGLVEDSNVKITDINGQLVFETSSLGGQAIWDGMDYNGNKAATGVYLVFSSSTDNFLDPDAIVTKILIVE